MVLKLWRPRCDRRNGLESNSTILRIGKGRKAIVTAKFKSIEQLRSCCSTVICLVLMDGWCRMNKNTQISKGRLSRLLGWLPHHGNPSKPNKSAVLEREPNCSIDLNLAVLSPGVCRFRIDYIHLWLSENVESSGSLDASRVWRVVPSHSNYSQN